MLGSRWSWKLPSFFFDYLNRAVMSFLEKAGCVIVWLL